MDFAEKAAVRLKRWITHNDSHQQEYQRFAAELDEAGKTESARQIREMVALSKRSNECLRRALEALEA
jgi:hypothetical protein